MTAIDATGIAALEELSREGARFAILLLLGGDVRRIGDCRHGAGERELVDVRAEQPRRHFLERGRLTDRVPGAHARHTRAP